jgi:hypothetical protein
MSGNDLQADYDALERKSLKSVAKLLGEAGKPFDLDLNEMLHETRKLLTAVPEFAVWMAEALVWARYARRDGDFFVAAATFIDSGDAEQLNKAVQFPDRFGPDRLREGLVAFGHWFEEMRRSLSQITPEPLRWKAIQERSLRVAETLKKDGMFQGVGLWLFPAPFKVMAAAHMETWSDPSLDAVVMPTGTQVERALSQLHGDGVIKIDKSIIAASAGTFADEYTNLWTLQLPQKDLAKACGSNVLHINGALYWLGDRSHH